MITQYCAKCGKKEKIVKAGDIEVKYCKGCKIYYPIDSIWLKVRHDALQKGDEQ